MKQRRMKASKWNKMVIGSAIGVLGILAVVTAVIDPFLHYHKPLPGLQYPLKDERYQNDGIARHYEYQAMITGTSMTQNFKASQFEELWGVKAIKTSFSGASFKEVNDAVLRAISYNPELEYVVRSIDGNRINYPADANEYTDYPEYLYDNNPFNDVSYLLNKEVIPRTLAVINYTRAGNTTPDMDEYGSWGQYKTYGAAAVKQTLAVIQGDFDEELELSEEDKGIIRENVEKNLLQTALDYPDKTFYFFFPPYSIYYWKALNETKQLTAQLEAESMTAEILLQAENIKVFAFSDDIGITADLDNYMDSMHYGPWINEKILEWMYRGEHQLTKDNYKQYFEQIKALYSEYSYEEIE